MLKANTPVHMPFYSVLSVSSNKTMDNQTAIRMELNIIILLVALQCVQKLLSDRKKKTRNRKIWVRDWLSRREKLGASKTLCICSRYESHSLYICSRRCVSDRCNGRQIWVLVSASCCSPNFLDLILYI